MASTSSRQVTFRQVAERTGVHVSTVSRALDAERRHLISSDIVARVEAAAKELGWLPNRVAASLRKGRSMAIGALIPDVLNQVSAQILQGLEAAVVSRSFFPLIVSMQAAKSSRAVVEVLLSQRVDGVVVMVDSLEEEIASVLVKMGVPAVLTARGDKAGRLSAVLGDRAMASELAIDHLVQLGHREIALLAGSQSQENGIERLKFAIAALQRRGLAPHSVGVCEDFSHREGQRVCATMLAERQSADSKARAQFTAICAASDTLAVGAYEAIRRAGLVIHRDISVMGQNDMMLAEVVSPALTTVRIHHYDIGHQAGHLLIDEIEAGGLEAAPRRPGRVITLRPEVVVRESTGAPPAYATGVRA
jgi:LacI family transcriptional regulator